MLPVINLDFAALCGLDCGDFFGAERIGIRAQLDAFGNDKLPTIGTLDAYSRLVALGLARRPVKTQVLICYAATPSFVALHVCSRHRARLGFLQRATALETKATHLMPEANRINLVSSNVLKSKLRSMNDVSQKEKGIWASVWSVVHSTWLGPLIIGVVLLLVGSHYFQPAPRVVYTLSDPIPVRLSTSASPDAVQQLSVTNVGNAKAENITVKLGQPVLPALTDPITKFSKGDQPKFFASKSSTELDYPLLPPGASFKFVFRVPQKADAADPVGVQSSDLKITSNDGAAQDAVTDKGTSASTGQWLYWVMVVVYLLLIISVVASEAALSRLWIDKPSDFHRVVRAKPPLFLTFSKRNRWQMNRETEFRKVATRLSLIDKVEEFPESLPLNILAVERPHGIEEKEWSGIRESARLTASKDIDFFLSGDPQQLLNKAASLTHFQTDFHQPTWDWLCSEAQKRALKRAGEHTFSHARFLALSKPEGFDDELWKQSYSARQESYKSELQWGVTLSSEPLEKLKEFDLSLLNQEQQQEVTERAYSQMCSQWRELSSNPDQLEKLIAAGRPQWADDTTWQILLSKQERNQHMAQEQERLEASRLLVEKQGRQNEEHYKEASQKAAEQGQRAEAVRRELVGLITTHQLSEQRPPSIEEKEWQDLEVLKIALSASAVHVNGVSYIPVVVDAEQHSPSQKAFDSGN